MERIIVTTVFWCSLISLIVWGSMRIKKDNDLNEAGAGYFFLAYKANTIQLAQENWDKAISFWEANNLTQGNTGAYWKTPEDDLAFFYANVLEMRNYLNAPPDTLSNSSFDQKIISGSILSEGKSFTVYDRQQLFERLKQTVDNSPGGISIYPHNRAYANWAWMSLFMFVVCCFWWTIRVFEWDGWTFLSTGLNRRGMSLLFSCLKLQGITLYQQ